MSETVEASVQVSAEPKDTTNFSPFGDNSWNEQIPSPQEQVNEVKTETTEVVDKPKEAEEVLSTKDWFKKEFEVDDHNVIKQQLKEYKELKEKPQAQEYKFENDESKKLAEAISKGDKKEIIKILETQERLNNFSAAEVTDDTAADIIKLGMKLKYQDLTDSEIEYKFNKQFGLPKEPVYDELKENEDEFAIRKAEWQEKVTDIKMNRNIEAKLAKPELEKLKSQIVLPEVNQPTELKANEPDPEVQRQIRENFLQKLDSDYMKVEGFKTLVKDESVEIPIQFIIPEADKVAIKGRLTEGMDVSEFMDKRWFDEKGVPNINQIMLDIYKLENEEKILSGVANKAASERLEAYFRSSKNLKINNGSSQTTFQPNGNGQQNVSPYSENAWSEKQPIIQN